VRKTLPIVLHNPKILLLGGGSVALQKATVMHQNGITFDTIAKAYDSSMKALSKSIVSRAVTRYDLHGYGIVIDATGSDAVTSMLLAYKREHNVLVNVVDQPEVCDFFFAALIQEGALKVAVSSSGASPTLAQEVRNKIRRMLPKTLAQLADTAQTKRLQGIIEKQKMKQRVKKVLGRVFLVGCGTGDVELLTLKAYRLIQEADVLLIDHLISDEIRAIIPNDTMTIYVGKRKGHHSMSQEQINELLLEYAHKGFDVARLKAGDPYLFGRGAEEAMSLCHEGVHVEVIPGISSALAAPLSAGIAPTARGYAANLSIVSAHLKGNATNLQWIDLLARENHTTIVLMGITKVGAIVEAAKEQGINQTLPCAIISNATRPNQTQTMTTLEHLVKQANGVEQPALLVFGDVVNLHHHLPYYQSIKDEHDCNLATSI